MSAPNLKFVKSAIKIMTIMIILGLILLFYGLATKSSKLMAPKEQKPAVSRVVPAVDTKAHLQASCKPILVAVEHDVLVFGSGEAAPETCPVAVVIDRGNGSLIQTFRASSND